MTCPMLFCSQMSPSKRLCRGATAVKTSLAPGFHVAAGRPVDSGAYDQSTGQWSRLFVPSVLDAAGVNEGCQVLDVATGTDEAALAMAPVIGASGLLVGGYCPRHA